MGFSGGGSNILKAHTHNGLIVQDGGALDFDDITQSQSSAGMVFYSDGTHLQQLAYPGSPAGETLTAAAASTAPSWAAAGGASVTLLGSQRLTSDASQMQVTFAAQTGETTGSIYACWTTVSDAASPYAYSNITINNVTTANWYRTQKLEMTGGAGTFSETIDAYIGIPSGARLGGGWIQCNCNTSQLSGSYDSTIGYSGTAYGESPGFRSKMFIGSIDAGGGSTQDEFTSIEITASTGNWRTGSQLAVYAYKI